MVRVLVYADEVSWAKQLASAAKSIGEPVLLTTIVDKAGELAGYFKKVYVAKSEVFEPLSLGRSLEEIMKREGSEIALFPCTNKGRMLSGIIAARMGSLAITDVIGIKSEGSAYRLTKLTFGGNAKADVVSEPPFVACISPGSFKEAEESEKGEVIEIQVEKPSFEVKFQPRKVEGVSPEKADVVIGAGRGVKKKEDLKLIQDLASLLNGAWSVTRPLAADYGWADSWIGISGLVIAPKLYIAVGISGQPHHMMGVRGAKVIVAINNDESAPIFEESDYGVVGDLYKVVPVLIEKLKERRG